jgi:hypothetical protein
MQIYYGILSAHIVFNLQKQHIFCFIFCKKKKVTCDNGLYDADVAQVGDTSLMVVVL